MDVEEIRNYQFPLQVSVMDKLKKKTKKSTAKEAIVEVILQYLGEE